MRNIVSKVFLSIGLVTLSTAAIAEIAVIVNPSVKVTSLSAEDVNAIYLGKTSSFPDGSKAQAVDQSAGASRDQFNEKILHKSDSQIKAYWAREIFSGKSQPPAEKGDSAAVKEFVAKTAGAIGYVDGSHADGSVKVVLRAG